MKRREFSFSAASAVAAASFAGTAHSQAAAPRAGKEYLVLDKPVSVDAAPGKIEVVEFFWYSCAHCNAFEPQLQAWIKAAPKDVVVRRVPVAFQPTFVPEQKLYYTLEALGKVDELHSKAFETIHNQKEKINTEALIFAWAAKQGLDSAKFKDTYNSFSVSTKVRRAVQLQDGFKVEGVPALGVAGRFYTDATMAGNMQRALEIVTFLAIQARKA